MDALTWFKSVFQRARPTPDALRADLATEPWADVPLHLAAARLRPPPARVDDDEDWDAVIARAKVQAASPNVRNEWLEMQPTPPPRNEWSEMQPTPPPSPKAPQAGIPQATQARLDALLLGGMKKPASARPAFTARRAAKLP